MKKSTAHGIVCAGLAGILAFGACGCSTSSESETTVTTEVTNENGATTTETTTTEKDGETETTTTESTTIDVADWEAAWYGQSSEGFDVYYAESPDGGATGLMVIYNPETETLESWVGDNTTDEENTLVTTTDASGESSFTFAILEYGDDDSLSIDMGEEYGTAELAPVAMDELLEMIAEVDVNGQVIA